MIQQRLNPIALSFLAVMLLAPAAHADEFPVAADVESYQLAEAENEMIMPRIEGQWVAYYDGREGRYVYDLTTRAEHDHIRQWSNIPFDLGNNYLIDAERLNMSYYNFEKKNRYKWKTNYEGVENVVVGSRWLAMTCATYVDTFKMRLHDVVAMRGGGNGRRVVAGQVALADVAMEGNLLVWADYRYDQAGAYLHNVDDRKTKRLTESDSVTQIDTDGKTVIWKDDDGIHTYDAATGTSEILFFNTKAHTIRSLKLDGDWLVFQDDSDAIYAHHRPTGRDLRVTSEIRHQGLIQLADVSGRNVIFTLQGKQLWVAELPEKVEAE